MLVQGKWKTSCRKEEWNKICSQFPDRGRIKWYASKKLVISPLIKVKILLQNSLGTSGIYDSGSNVPLIDSKLIKETHKWNKTQYE